MARMIVGLADMKSYLGVVTNDDDAFLTLQLQIVTDAIERYCQRIFNIESYTQTYYIQDFIYRPKDLYLYHYPLVTLTSITQNGNSVALLRTLKKVSKLTSDRVFFDQSSEEIVVEYDAGYDDVDMPPSLKQVVYSLVQERYNKKKSGINLEFGSEVQQISIPGTINISYDYTLQANDRSSAFGMILGNYANVLDAFRSERRLVGTIKGGEYVE